MIITKWTCCNRGLPHSTCPKFPKLRFNLFEARIHLNQPTAGAAILGILRWPTNAYKMMTSTGIPSCAIDREYLQDAKVKGNAFDILSPQGFSSGTYASARTCPLRPRRISVDSSAAAPRFAVWLILQGQGDRLLTVFAIVCSSFVAANVGTSKRPCFFLGATPRNTT